MSSAIRLYERLDQIPQDPSDPESLDDLIVCAFGAFERYYVCWRNKAGEYRQDGYDLPPALQEWLWPPDNTTRDFASLQVVFGRGDEYFASDKDGKLEYKEPEKKPSDMTTTTSPTPEEKPTLRRTRTMSAFRGVPPETTKPLPPAPYDPVSPSRRSSLSASRPPSMSFSLSDTSSTRSPSISSMFSTLDPMPTIASRPPSEYHHHVDASSSPFDSSSSSKPITTADDSTHIVTTATALRLKRRSRPLSICFKPSLTHARLSQTKPTPSSAADTDSAPTPTPQPSHQPPATTTTTSTTTASAHCTCHLHPPPHPPQLSISIASAIATSPRQPTSFSSSPSYTPRNTAYFEDDEYVAPLPAVNPFPMGSMMAFFSKPGYQLGDGLRRYDEDDEGGGFGVVEEGYEGEGYEGEEGFYEDEWAAWEAANGRV